MFSFPKKNKFNKWHGHGVYKKYRVSQTTHFGSLLIMQSQALSSMYPAWSGVRGPWGMALCVSSPDLLHLDVLCSIIAGINYFNSEIGRLACENVGGLRVADNSKLIRRLLSPLLLADMAYIADIVQNKSPKQTNSTPFQTHDGISYFYNVMSVAFIVVARGIASRCVCNRMCSFAVYIADSIV